MYVDFGFVGRALSIKEPDVVRYLQLFQYYDWGEKKLYVKPGGVDDTTATGPG